MVLLCLLGACTTGQTEENTVAASKEEQIQQIITQFLTAPDHDFIAEHDRLLRKYDRSLAAPARKEARFNAGLEAYLADAYGALCSEECLQGFWRETGVMYHTFCAAKGYEIQVMEIDVSSAAGTRESGYTFSATLRCIPGAEAESFTHILTGMAYFDEAGEKINHLNVNIGESFSKLVDALR